MLHLIKMWLEAPVAEIDDHGNKRRSNGERDEDAGLLSAGREVRLSGIYVRSLLLDEEGPSLSRHGAIQEAGTTPLSRDQRRDQTCHVLEGSQDTRSQAQPDADRVG